MKKLTELVIIIDKSGSMHGLEKDVVGGFNALIDEQRKEGKTKVTTVFFNDKVDFLYDGVDISQIKHINGRNYQPRGCTALLDAIGDSISLIKAKHSKLREQDLPKHTIFSIMTDGLENASREYSYKRIKDMIKLQKKCGWDFIFQAANIDTEYEANRLGIDRDMAMSFITDSDGVGTVMKCCSNKICDVRNSNKRK